VGKVSAGGQLHHDMECKSDCESSDSSVGTKNMYHSAVDLGQSPVPDNACQRPKNELINVTDDSVGHLSFCDVEIEGLPNSVRALGDSGTQLSLVNPKVIDTLTFHGLGR